MIKKYDLFVNEEYDSFYDDLEISKHKIKLFSKFKSNIKDINIQTNFDLGKPKLKFKPRVKIFQNSDSKNKIF